MTEEGAAIIEYLKSLREEIHLRVAEHTRLVQIKVISLAAIIAFIINKIIITGNNNKTALDQCLTSPLICFVWIFPLAAVAFDLMIAGNLRVICNLGVYIKNHIERMALVHIKDDIAKRKHPKFGFWEETVAQAGSKYHCYTILDIAVIWMFTLASWLFCFWLRDLLKCELPQPYYWITGAVCALGVALAAYCLYCALKMKREF